MGRTTDARLERLERAAAVAPAAPMHEIILADPTDPASEFYGLVGGDLHAAVDKRLADLPPMAGIRAIIAIEPTTQEREVT